MGPITREMVDNFVSSLEEDHRRAMEEPDWLECRTLPMDAVKRLARANIGARFILHKWQYDELVQAGLI